MDKILVLDFGGQYAHLIANRIRRLGVYTEISNPRPTAKDLLGVKGIILSGGPSSVYAKNAPKYSKKIFSLGIPMLGICYGHQLMTRELKGKVSPGKVKEYGLAKVNTRASEILKGVSRTETVWMSHGDTVSEVPPGFKTIASTKNCPIAGMADEKRKLYGVQFHPEVTHTPRGMTILENFIRLTGTKRTWSMKKYLTDIKRDIKLRAKGRNVFLLVSGGVDSTVCFILLNKLLGKKRVLGMHIDNGLMRKNESRKVEKALLKNGFDNLMVINEANEFVTRLKDVINPEDKRRIIGEYFLTAYKDSVTKLKLNPKNWLLAQGTIYPDTIETGGTKHSALIKTHHNRVPVLKKMIDKGLVLEPLANLYKDEVRQLGEMLGLPKNLVHRHPFPGPGLGVRCLCSSGRERVSRSDNAKLAKLLHGSGYKGHIAAIRSVGVQGDFRTYRHPAIITGPEDHKRLERISTMITNHHSEINRVMLIVGKMKTMTTRKAHVSMERLDLLREADNIANTILQKHKLYHEVWQMPIVLVPLGDKHKESIVIRPIESTEAMTARFARLPFKVINEMAKKLLKLPIDAVFFDVTNKPPGTIEWE